MEGLRQKNIDRYTTSVRPWRPSVVLKKVNRAMTIWVYDSKICPEVLKLLLVASVLWTKDLWFGDIENKDLERLLSGLNENLYKAYKLCERSVDAHLETLLQTTERGPKTRRGGPRMPWLIGTAAGGFLPFKRTVHNKGRSEEDGEMHCLRTPEEWRTVLINKNCLLECGVPEESWSLYKRMCQLNQH